MGRKNGFARPVHFREDRLLNEKIRSVIVGTGSYIPTEIVRNESFLANEFRDQGGKRYDKTNQEVIADFERITGITERRYVSDDQVSSDIAYLAAKEALDSSGVDPERLDYIVLAHNFGDVQAGNRRSDFVPSLASRVKHKLGLRNPHAVAYDLAFGCPGWVQGMIQADYYLRSGDCGMAMVIGVETLSRLSDPHDRDSMIYADGAGATILEAVASEEPVGILSHAARTDTVEEAYLLWMGRSNDPDHEQQEIFLKMDGRSVYEYALRTVPTVVKESLDKAGLGLHDVDKILIHQANEKMDQAILKRLGQLYGVKDVIASIMPMTISWLGNSSVATIPTMLDLLHKGKLGDHRTTNGTVYVLTSVGAGMNINSLVYRCP
jgi:3-oxoacyl-[acyl-carrier-protein] synthase-3